MDFEDDVTLRDTEQATPNSSVSEEAAERKVAKKPRKKAAPKESPYKDMPTLRINNRGEQVKKWQKLMKDMDAYDHDVNGYFGHQLHQATARFQRFFGLKPTGVVTAETWDLMAYLEDNA